MYESDQDPRPIPSAAVDRNGRANEGADQKERRGTFGQTQLIEPIDTKRKKKPEPIKSPPDRPRRGTFGQTGNQLKPIQDQVAPIAPQPNGRHFGADNSRDARAGDSGKNPKFNPAAAIREEFDFNAKMRKNKELDGVLARGEQARKMRGYGKPGAR